MKKLEIVIVNVAMAISMLALFFLFTHKELSEQEPLLSSYENRERMQTLQSDESRLIESLVKPREDSTIEKKKSHPILMRNRKDIALVPTRKKNPAQNAMKRAANTHPVPSNTDEPKESEHNPEKSERQRSAEEPSKEASPFVWSVLWPPVSSDENETDEGGGALFDDEFTSIEDLIEKIGGELGNAVFLQIFKEEASMELWMSVLGTYRLLKTYKLSKYSYLPGPKLEYGDGHIPEGFYTLEMGSSPESAIGISYPNDYDKMLHRSTERIYITRKDSCREGDICMKEEELEELRSVVDAAAESGYSHTRIDIYPFRMDEASLKRHYSSKWYPFWENLKEGYDFFRLYKRPPRVDVEDGRYSFHMLKERNPLFAYGSKYR